MTNQLKAIHKIIKLFKIDILNFPTPKINLTGNVKQIDKLFDNKNKSLKVWVNPMYPEYFNSNIKGYEKRKMINSGKWENTFEFLFIFGLVSDKKMYSNLPIGVIINELENYTSIKEYLMSGNAASKIRGNLNTDLKWSQKIIASAIYEYLYRKKLTNNVDFLENNHETKVFYKRSTNDVYEGLIDHLMLLFLNEVDDEMGKEKISFSDHKVRKLSNKVSLETITIERQKDLSIKHNNMLDTLETYAIKNKLKYKIEEIVNIDFLTMTDTLNIYEVKSYKNSIYTAVGQLNFYQYKLDQLILQHLLPNKEITKHIIGNFILEDKYKEFLKGMDIEYHEISEFEK